MITTKRVYDAQSAGDGYRVLVERLWPRGLTREAAALDAWLKDIAPSPDLRKWFAHDAAKWEEFQSRYRKELASPVAQPHLADLHRRAKAGRVTLLYASREDRHNSASVLLAVLTGRSKHS